MILLIDNYDSFSYNLVQFFGTLCLENKGPLTPHRSGECTGTVPAGTEAAGPEAAEPEIAGTKPDIRVIRNDAMTPEEIRNLHPDHIILSPGPGYPKNAGVCEDVVRQMKGEVPILGVCLGHQGICEVFGAEIVHAARLMHGKQSTITIDNSDPIFQGLPEKIPAARYHSLVARRSSLPDTLKIIGEDDMGEIMAVRHTDYPIYGLQFHPESILTPDGMTILRNFLNL